MVLYDSDGNLFPSEEPAFVASSDVSNQFLAEHGVARRYEAEELRLATTGLNCRSNGVALALEHGIPVAPGLAQVALVPPVAGSTAAGPELTPAEVNVWLGREKRAVTAHQ